MKTEYRTIETVKDTFGEWEQRWACAVPDMDVKFVVTEQEWLDDYSVRIIKAIEVISE